MREDTDGTIPWILDLWQCHNPEIVGGKAINLARMLRAGFTVPGGFTLTTAAYRMARRHGEAELPEALADAIRAAYRAMGGPRVAVRSSATAEDLAEASMAGQYETFLNVKGEEALLRAVTACWASLDSPRTRAYLERLGLTPAEVAMGVVVQEQVEAEVAGVLFTVNPRDGAGGTGRTMLAEASWGLGESVVSGTVQPDTLVLDAETGTVREAVIGRKATWIRAAGGEEAPEGEEAVPEDRQSQPCLNAEQVRDLWRLGRAVEAHYGRPQDLEWAFAGGTLYLLQSRAITTLEGMEAREACLSETRAALRTMGDGGRGPWVRHNLAETLPLPTPLCWTVVRRFMSGEGGFGELYRMIGFRPSPLACREGILDLVGGRIYLDLSRAGEMFLEDFPYAYDPDELRNHPGAAQEPPTVPTGSAMDRYRAGKTMAAAARKLDALAEGFDREFVQTHAPAFRTWIKEEKQRDLSALSAEAWRAVWTERERKVLDGFAPLTLLPSFIVTRQLQLLGAFLEQHLWDGDAEDLTRRLVVGGEPDSTLRSAQMLWEVGRGEAELSAWLERFGHRAPSEFDPATPRWRERPDEVEKMAARMREGEAPLARHRQQTESARSLLEETRGRLSGPAAEELTLRVEMVRRYVRYREDGKHELMAGYDLLRDLVLEARRRLGVSDDLCLLDLDEIQQALSTGYAPLEEMARRRARRKAEADLRLPVFLDEEAVGTLGDPPRLEGGAVSKGLSVSGGRCEGPARIVHAPDQAGELGEGYVLVCPSTDPNWTPLFTRAAGLVLECGGSLSHGAVVAREMGLPAVVIPDATRLFEEGETLRVDGGRGVVCKGGAAADTDSGAPEAEEVPGELIPPPPGPKELGAMNLRNVALGFWAVFFALYYLLPEAWLARPVTGVLDRLLLPLMDRFGPPALVAGVAVFFGMFCMFCQWWMTDTPRLREVKRRVRLLKRHLKTLPPGHEHHALAAGWTKASTRRNLEASFVPLAVLLGPMLLVFFWFPERVEALWHNPPAGTTHFVTVSVDGDSTSPVSLRVPEGFTLEQPVEQRNPPIRATLEALHRRWSQSPPPAEDLPWDLRAAALRTREDMLVDLRAYLDRGVPARDLVWIVHPPEAAEGRFPVRVEAGDQSLEGAIVLGMGAPPAPREIVDPSRPPMQVVPASGEGPMTQMTVSHAPRLERGAQVFWPPVEPFTLPPILSGWLLVYLIAYLPAMYLARWTLRIP